MKTRLPGTPERPPPAAAAAAKADRRVYVWWGAGFGLLALLALFCWLVAAPVLEVRREVGLVWQQFVAHAGSADGELSDFVSESVARLGGPDKAYRKIKFYWRLPERVAPAKDYTIVILGGCGEQSVDDLVALLDCYDRAGPSSTVAWSLGNIGPPARKAIPSLVRLAARASASWGRGGGVYVDPLRRIDPEGTETVPLLMKLLENEQDSEMRSGAAVVLGAIGSPARQAVPLIVKALDDPAMARNATRALILLGPDAEEAVPALVRMLESKDFLVRRNAAWALGRMGPRAAAAAPALLALVSKMDSWRWHDPECVAVLALGRTGNRTVLPAMVALLDEGKVAEVHPIGAALAMIGPDVIPEMLKIEDEISGLYTVAWVLGEMGPDAKPAVPWLIGKLRRREARFAWAEIARALGRMGPAAVDAVPALIESLGNTEDADLRREAAVALGCIGPEAAAALPQLEKMSTDADPCVRLAVAVAVWKIQGAPDKALKLLVDALADKVTRRHAIEELGLLGPAAAAAVPVLEQHLPESAAAVWRITGTVPPTLDGVLQRWFARQDVADLTGGRGVRELQQEEWFRRLQTARGRYESSESCDEAIRSNVVFNYWRLRGIDDPPNDHEW